MKNLFLKSLAILSLILAFGLFGKVLDDKPEQKSNLDQSKYSLERISGKKIVDLDIENISNTVDDNYTYFGLSGYLGNVIPVSVTKDGTVARVKLDEDKPTSVDQEWVGFRGRFKTVLIRAPEAKISFNENGLVLDWGSSREPQLDLLRAYHDDFKMDIKDMDLPAVGQLQYLHLPKILQYLCHFVEWLYKSLVNLTLVGWGLGLFIFALAIRLLMWPISSLTKKYQLAVNEHRSHLAPIHADIKKTLKGQKAHNAFMKSYKDRGITPYYTLKPLMITLIGLPVLIAIFNMLGEVNALSKTSFLWIDSLAYPDHFATLPFSIPFFGNRLNLLPFLMTIVTIVSAVILRDKNLSTKDLNRQKYNLYLMAIMFFFLFYNFPSGMVLYWTIASTLALLITRN